MRSNLSSSLSTAARTVSGSSSSSANWRGTRPTTSSSPSPSSLRIASIWRRSNISRCCLSRPSVTSLRMLVLQLEVGERLARPRRAPARGAPRRRSSRAARRAAPASRSGEYAAMSASCPGVVDAGEDVADAARAAVLEDRLDDRAVLAWPARARGRSASGSSTRLDLHVQRALVADRSRCRRGPGRRRGSRGRGCRWAARPRSRSGRSCRRLAYRPSTRGTSTSRSPACSAAAPGALRLVGLERDRDDHLREHDALRERQQGQQLASVVV